MSSVHAFPQKQGRGPRTVAQGPTPVIPNGRVVGFAEACARVGYSVRHGRRLMREGRFPVPLLQRDPHGPKRQKLRVSSVEIDLYLNRNSVEGVRRRV